MTKPIVLYDQHHERVGETYPRRAKQLVKSGRASWLIDGQSLQINTEYNPYPPNKEDVIEMSEAIYQNNGTIVEEPGHLHKEEPSELLLYMAKQNVAQKKSLIRNIIAYVLAWPILHTVFRFFPRVSTWNAHTDQTAIRRVVHEFPEVFVQESIPFSFWFPNPNGEYFSFEVPNRAWSGINDLVVSLTGAGFEQIYQPTTISSITRNELWWHFILGAMVAWGVWIAVRCFKVLRRRTANRAPKPDPILLEYQRLQSSI
ncbi:MAG: hypothetical protein FWE11_04165 [Defluviitaleaceae bacterium]|nr:hypothetical protein [Defluviitaleaceae bacterium]